ncbi:MAG: hypothetical protein EP305_03090 [Bacteroidetes bacterium]|nr:MAG: hypothetical protein EP305_03090 [Bacteroidota bacterium]
MNKTPLLLTAICYAIYRIISYLTGEVWLPMLILLIPIGILLLNLILRKKLTYKNWFLSPLNLLLERKTQSFQSEIKTDLLYDKLQEVISNSTFSLLDSNKETLSILCGTSVNFWTWGENIYVQLEETNEGSNITITSVTIFGNTSWNRNQKNFESFVDSFEASLTI